MRLQTYPHTSESLVDRIERTISSRTSGKIRGLCIKIFDNEVVLTGRASNYYTKQLATHAAFDAARNVSLINEIEVCPPGQVTSPGTK